MIAMSNIHQADLYAQEETHQDVEKLIYRLCWKAVYKFGGEWEDYLSAANEAFADAYTSYDAKKGASFATWLWWKVKGAIGKERSQNSIQARTVASGEDIDLDVLPDRSRFDYDSFVDELGNDAKTVVKMVVESPHEIWDILHHKNIGTCVRGGLIRRLQAVGWTVARVAESFSEIREALQ